MYITTSGLILRSADYSESSKMLTILTAGEGKLAASAKGVKRKNSKIAAAVQLLTYSELTLSGNNGRWTVAEARTIEEFRGLREDIKLLSLGTYFAEMLEDISNEGCPDPELLSLGLNGIYSLASGRKSPELVKAAFEIKIMCTAGYAPAVHECPACGKRPQKPEFSLTGGAVYCSECAGNEERCRLTEGAYDALCYIVDSDPKKIYSFRTGEETQRCLGNVSEKYVRAQLERDFPALDFYKGLS